MTPKEVLQLARENECALVDLTFQDLFGAWQHCSRPIQELKEATFESGYELGSASARPGRHGLGPGLLLVPEPGTACIDPFPREKTLHLTGSLRDQRTGEAFARDPRSIARKAEAYLKDTGIADAAAFGAEIQFFLFDEVRFDQTRNSAFYIVDSIEGRWNSGRDEQPNLGYKPRNASGQFPSPPSDTLNDLRSEMVMELARVGVDVEFQRHGPASGGQGEIGLRSSPLLSQGDKVQWLKYVVKNAAFRGGKTATFMPKPLFEDCGSGMRVSQSLWKKGQNLFAGDEYGGLSQLALWYLGGLLKHAPALCALCNPSTNSYKRLVPGCEAPIALGYSNRDPAAAVWVPVPAKDRLTRSVQLLTPDPCCNPHLAFSALLLAGLDGIENRTEPGAPLEADLAPAGTHGRDSAPSVPRSLEEALLCLERDHDFLLSKGIFTEDVLQFWIEQKRKTDVAGMNARPAPWEFALYYDC